MQVMKISVTGNTAVVSCLVPVTAGMVGMPVEFTFDESWEELEKTAVFRAGNVTLDRLSVDSVTTVPWELLQRPGCHLFAGVYGCNRDGSVQIPTVWADLGVILPGADPTGDESADPTAPVWQKLQNQAQAMAQTLDSQQRQVAENAEALATAQSEIAANRTDLDNNAQTLDAIEKELRNHAQILEEHDTNFVRQNIVLLAETVLPEDATQIEWTKGAKGEVLSQYKDFFIYWVGKFDEAATNQAWVLRANDGNMYYTYMHLSKPADRCGFWWSLEEVYKKGNTTIWKTTFPGGMLGQYTSDFDYYNQGLSGANKAQYCTLTCNTTGAKIEKIQFGSLSAGAKMVAGSKVMLLGRKRE